MNNLLLYKTNNKIEHHVLFNASGVQISGVRLFYSVGPIHYKVNSAAACMQNYQLLNCPI